MQSSENKKQYNKSYAGEYGLFARAAIWNLFCFTLVDCLNYAVTPWVKPEKVIENNDLLCGSYFTETQKCEIC